MKHKNTYWIIGGLLNLFTAMIHLMGGQLTLIDPLLKSGLEAQVKTELLGVWHTVTVILFLSTYVLIKNGIGRSNPAQITAINNWGWIYLLSGLAFIGVSLLHWVFAPQWVLLIPIGIFCLLGVREH
ncbi:hypothetical protein [Aureispira anguillae]|uniref:Uncharacterized protein n=1 Tax=Aureispira anguillae TaxID=2864201 RepID=A0A915YGS7_9BACT|nr:hypothetical protein [Aureispira anguillae]BDS12678.1 hypothetical protein AsAng_0034020 [Aureispira anguillae]